MLRGACDDADVATCAALSTASPALSGADALIGINAESGAESYTTSSGTIFAPEAGAWTGSVSSAPIYPASRLLVDTCHVGSIRRAVIGMEYDDNDVALGVIIGGVSVRCLSRGRSVWMAGALNAVL